MTRFDCDSPRETAAAQGELREETRIHQSGGLGILQGELAERVIKRDQLFVVGVQGDFDVVEINAAAFTAPIGTLARRRPAARAVRRRADRGARSRHRLRVISLIRFFLHSGCSVMYTSNLAIGPARYNKIQESLENLWI